MSDTSEAFEAAIQRLLPLIGTGDLEHTKSISRAVYRLTAAADRFSVSQAKQNLSDALCAAAEVDAKRELADIIEVVMCCEAGIEDDDD